MLATRTAPPLEDLRPLTVRETAELIRKSPRDVERKIVSGTFKTVEPPRRGRTPLITVASVRAYLEGGVLKSIAAAAPVAAASYHGAATLVRGLRTIVIGKLILDAVSLAAAIISGGASAGASFLIRTGVGAAINVAIDQAMNALLGGE